MQLQHMHDRGFNVSLMTSNTGRRFWDKNYLFQNFPKFLSVWPTYLQCFFTDSSINTTLYITVCILIYSSHSQWHVSTGNYGQHQVVLGFYKRKKLGRVLYLTSSRRRSWLRHCATSRKFAGSITDSVIEIFHWLDTSDRTVALGSTQTLKEMSTTDIFWR
jgi:hypothetical protein